MSFLLLLGYSLGFRWFVFEYKRMEWFRAWMRRSKWQGVQELLSCCYCQMIEASLVVYLVGYVSGEVGWSWLHPFALLANGLVAICLEGRVDRAISEMEQLHRFKVKTVEPVPHWGLYAGFIPEKPPEESS